MVATELVYQTWEGWCTLVIPALGMLKQEAHSLRPVSTTERDHVSKGKIKKKKKELLYQRFRVVDWC